MLCAFHDRHPTWLTRSCVSSLEKPRVPPFFFNDALVAQQIVSSLATSDAIDAQ